MGLNIKAVIVKKNHIKTKFLRTCLKLFNGKANAKRQVVKKYGILTDILQKKNVTLRQ